jgi:hypothetical protein
MTVKLTAKQEKQVYTDYMKADADGKAEIRAAFPDLDWGNEIPEDERKKVIEENDHKWTETIGLREVYKQRAGYDLMITFVCVIKDQEFRVVFDIKTLLEVRAVRNALVAATEKVPVMPAAKDWPTAVERLLEQATKIEEDQISRQEWVTEQIASYLATGMQYGDTPATRESHMFEIIGGTGTTHSVYDAYDHSVIIHQEPLTTWLAKRAEMDRRSLEQLLKSHLTGIFEPYRMPGGKGKRGYWKQRAEILKDVHGIEIPKVGISTES